MVIVLPLSRALRNELIDVLEADGRDALDYVVSSFLKRVILDSPRNSTFRGLPTTTKGFGDQYSKLVMRMVVQYRKYFVNVKYREVTFDSYTVSRGTINMRVSGYIC